jgi:hypothetical protein
MPTDNADRRTPKEVREELGRYGGLNPYGLPNWRVVLAEDRREIRGGIFTTMPSGNTENVFDYEPCMVRGKKVYRIHAKEVKPIKVETGIHSRPAYPCQGWILERWFPAHKKGIGKAEWEAVKSTDGITPMMGPYPHEGFYFMVDGPWSRLPEMSVIRWAISAHIRTEEEQPASYAQAVLEDMHADEEEHRKKYEKVVSDLSHFYESEVEPVMRGSSLSAGIIRNELAAARGDHSHQGVI